MSDSPKIYVVAGATRGIGLALVAGIASRDPTAIIYAGGRDPSGSKHLVNVAAKYPGRIELVKYFAADEEGNKALAKEIKEKHGRVDTLIANAAIGKSTGNIHETPIQNFQDHFTINTMGPVVLFQAFYDLLKASSLPRFLAISSGAGSLELIAGAPTFDNAPYGMSKAALNWIIRKIHYENEWLIAYPQCPGAVDTDMLRVGIERDTTGVFREIIKSFGMRQPDEAVSIVLDILEASTREKDGGQFHNITLGRHPW